MVLIEINTEDYPLIHAMPDAKGYIKNLLDRDYSIFRSQHSPQAVCDVMESVQETLDTLQDMIRTEQTANSTALNSALTKLTVLMANPSKKGTLFENLGDELFSTHLCNNTYTVITTSKTARSADRRITKKDFELLFDWKHYTTNVPTGEVEKLKRDMDEQSVRCGIIANVDKGFSKYANTDLEFFDNKAGQLCCIAILGKVGEQPMKAVLSVYYLETIWNKILKQESFGNKHSTDGLPVGNDSVKQDFSDIIEMANGLLRIIESYESHRDVIQRSMNDFHKSLMKSIHSHVASINARLS